MTIATESTNVEDRNNDGYEQFSASIRQRFTQSVADNKYLFTTDATGLFDAFLAALPDEARQHYTCLTGQRITAHPAPHCPKGRKHYEQRNRSTDYIHPANGSGLSALCK